MADTVVKDDAVDTSTSDGGTPDAAATSVTPTAENRDAATFAKYGLSADGVTPLPEKSADDTSAPADDADKGKTPDADKGADDADGDDATKSSDDSTADAATDASTANPDEITDEDVEDIVAALEDRLIANPKLAAQIEARAAAEANRRIEESRRTQTDSEETDRLIDQGREATTSLYGLLGNVSGELAKAAKGEPYDPTPPDPEKVKGFLGQFGGAVVAETRRHFDNGFTASFRAVAKELGVEFDPADAEKIKTIIQTTERIEGDKEQGRGPAIAYLYTESWKLLTAKAKEAGRTEALAEVKRQEDASAKIKDKNSETSALAKIRKQRKNSPAHPVAPEAGSEASGGDDLSDDAYRAAKRAGNHAEADRIVEQRALQGIGRR